MSIVTDIFLPLALAFIMFALGLGLTGSDFLRVIKQPKDFFVGAISQIILLPVIAFILISIWPISPELAIGVMIIAAAPGGVTSNILTSFAKGDVALSVSLTAIISLLCVVTVPFIIITSLNLLNVNNITQNISLKKYKALIKKKRSKKRLTKREKRLLDDTLFYKYCKCNLHFEKKKQNGYGICMNSIYKNRGFKTPNLKRGNRCKDIYKK